MSSPSGFLTDEQRKLMRSFSQGRDIPEEKKFVRTVSHGQHAMPDLAGSPETREKSGAKLVSVSSGEVKRDRHSHSGKCGRPKKGGGGGKGTWGKVLTADNDLELDRNDPNYDSEEEPYQLVAAPALQSLEEYKGKVVSLIEEYFAAGDVASMATDLSNLESPNYHHHFVKKLISMAMDHHDKEKEMASVLLSALYADVLKPEQLAKGFTNLLESVEDLVLDIPEAVDILAIFLARAVVDDILPPAFLSKTRKLLVDGSQGLVVVQKAEKSYLSAPHHAEIIERKWGGSTHTTVAEVQAKIVTLLKEYVESGDKAEACRCIRELNVPFFHHEVVKKALVLAMEEPAAEGKLWSLLIETAEEGLITSSQMSKGFTRISDSIHDLALDIPQAKDKLESFTSKAVEEGWVSAPFSRAVVSELGAGTVGIQEARAFKANATNIIQEYFLSSDISEVITSLEDLAAPDYHAAFVKRLILLALDRKNREKEMASVLVSELYAEVISIASIARAYTLLLQSAEDTSLDIPDAANQLSLFLARAVVDDILAPLHLDEISEQLVEGSLGREIVRMAQSMLSARHAGERILRC
ncbi:MA3 DOMAIN-CONTAINING TRANSLATION REGULATORY FACTOR 3 [Physcomitrium patens]|uniref:MI domain-containing protein n=2 Tax=Physcomitrium patens TaxID=3218 RepID=A0A7I4B5S2_PHYPA|nr:programmed cell death protein 4-like [Physcomitrium patens]|eukprot:XP_024399349.1 programmed cell death protein 4-like [Physcomitrella patens]